MELSAGSSYSSSSSSSADHSLNSLKFGKKIYFEDVGGGVHGKSSAAAGGSSSGLPRPAPTKKGRSRGVQGGQRPRCQVEGCQVDLSDAKAYYSRHKVCGMHSKSPKVIVAGLEQRFCQQCSRFHLLPEFDQGKRSCHRSLAGHNERRRKPPASILSPSYGSLSSSIFENNSRGGGILMDFSAYPNLTGRDSWPNTRASHLALSNHPAGTGKFLQQPWQRNCESPPSELLLKGSATRTGYPGPGIPSGDCFTGVSDSNHALSLLSNQPWDSRNRPLGLGANSLLNSNGTLLVQQSGTNGAPTSHFSSPSWGFKGTEASISSHEMPPDLGLGQMSQPPNCQYSGELGVAQQSGRQYLELDHSRGYNSSVQHMNWSL